MIKYKIWYYHSSSLKWGCHGIVRKSSRSYKLMHNLVQTTNIINAVLCYPAQFLKLFIYKWNCTTNKCWSMRRLLIILIFMHTILWLNWYGILCIRNIATAWWFLKLEIFGCVLLHSIVDLSTRFVAFFIISGWSHKNGKSRVAVLYVIF